MFKKTLLTTGLLLTMTMQTVFATTLDIDDYHRVIIQSDTPSNEKYELNCAAIVAETSCKPASIVENGDITGQGIVGISVAAMAIDCKKGAYYLELGDGGSGLVRRSRTGSDDWDMSSDTEGGGPVALLNNAESWFNTWGSTWKAGLSTENWNDGTYRIDKDENGQQYVCNSLYVRYTNINDQFELITVPGWTNGPYVTWGTNFDDVLDYRQIKADPYPWVVTAASEVGYDAFGGDWNWNNRSSVFQKHSEYRWYITPGTNPTGEPFAYVYPMERIQQIQQTESELATPSGNLTTKASGTGNDVSFKIAAKVDMPIINTDLSAAQINLYTSEKTKTYSFKSGETDPSLTSGEPAERQLKAWYSNLQCNLSIALPGGKNYTKKMGNSFNFSTSVPLSALGTGNANLEGTVVNAVYTYDENQRFMSLMDANIDMYSIINFKTKNEMAKGNYMDSVTYINDKLGNTALNQTSIASMTKYHNNKDRLTKKTFVTVTKKKTVTISGTLSYITEETPILADVKPLTITVKVFPNQPTTVLEGGSIYATIDAKGIDGGIDTTIEKAPAPYAKTYYKSKKGGYPADYTPSGEKKYAEWQSDVKIDQVKVTSKEGNVLYDSLNTDNPPTITSTDGIHRVAIRVAGGQGKILANAVDIGVATITVDYSYHWKERKETGNKTYRTGSKKKGYVYHRDKTYTTVVDLPQKGEQKFTFTIYSLSGQTVTK